MRYNYGGWGDKEQQGEQWFEEQAILKKNLYELKMFEKMDEIFNNATPNEKNKILRISKIKNQINDLYTSIDDTFNNTKNLINKENPNSKDIDSNFLKNYENFEQTDFGSKLIYLLQFIAINCDKYIKKLFANYTNKDSRWFSAYDCYGRKDISELYDYLKDEKFTEKSLMGMNFEQREYEKKLLKHNLRLYLLRICQNSEEKKIIAKLDIRIEGIDKWTPPLPETDYTTHSKKENTIFNIPHIEPFEPTETLRTEKGYGFGIGGNSKITKISKKEILGKERCIYKISGDKKQYLKHKGGLITITEYKKIMAAKNKK